MQFVPQVLTPARCAAFAGAAVTLANPNEGYAFAGTVESLAVTGDEATLRFTELRRTEGEPAASDDQLETTISLDIYAVIFEGDSLHVVSPIIGEHWVLTPVAGKESNPLRELIGGDVELNEGYSAGEGMGIPGRSTRGPVTALSFDGSTVTITCEWLGGAAPKSGQFEHKLLPDSRLVRDLTAFAVVGGKVDNLGRYVLFARELRETLVFFGPHGKKLTKPAV